MAWFCGSVLGKELSRNPHHISVPPSASLRIWFRGSVPGKELSRNPHHHLWAAVRVSADGRRPPAVSLPVSCPRWTLPAHRRLHGRCPPWPSSRPPLSVAPKIDAARHANYPSEAARGWTPPRPSLRPWSPRWPARWRWPRAIGRARGHGLRDSRRGGGDLARSSLGGSDPSSMEAWICELFIWILLYGTCNLCSI
jgi:hypothetical protein